MCVAGTGPSLQDRLRQCLEAPAGEAAQHLQGLVDAASSGNFTELDATNKAGIRALVQRFVNEALAAADGHEGAAYTLQLVRASLQQ